MRILKSHRSFGGTVRFCEHDSVTTKTKMNFSTFIPDGAVKGCLVWLSGLTCTDENFMAKAGAQRYLTEHGLMVICPDTSPRGLNLPGEHDASDFGSGAGFYVDATTAGYREHYLMYSYVTNELYGLIENEFQMKDRISIFGHSMGGHGALTIGLKNPNKFKSISAFAPIANPMDCPWGQKAFRGYLGENRTDWQKYDACALIANRARHPGSLLIDQGSEDPFLKDQLLPGKLTEACSGTDQKLVLNIHQGFDHSYYFIASFIEQHIQFHANMLTSTQASGLPEHSSASE